MLCCPDSLSGPDVLFAEGVTMTDLPTLQAVRLKGRPSPADVAGATGASEADATAALQALASSGHVVEKNERYRITPEGKEALERALAEERASVDADALKGIYDEFTPLNQDFKEMVTDWQQRDGEPNDHSDADYDNAVLARLDGVHERFTPLLERISAIAPRLASYPPRFEAALEKVRAGDHAWFLRPIIDSYHTVWFELHEELIVLSGLSRAEEAAAGRAE
jgi:DNA-binding MarR family transcriptional regulator